MGIIDDCGLMENYSLFVWNMEIFDIFQISSQKKKVHMN